MAVKTKTVVIPRKKVWQGQGGQDKRVNAAIEKLERKGWQYVGQQMEWAGLRLNFQRAS